MAGAFVDLPTIVSATVHLFLNVSLCKILVGYIRVFSYMNSKRSTEFVQYFVKMVYLYLVRVKYQRHLAGSSINSAICEEIS